MMKRILKLFAVLWLIVGCSVTQSTTQKLAGEYVYTDDDGEESTIVLESPDGKDNTSGNASYKDDDDAYYGTYKVYEGTEMVVIELDDNSISGITLKFQYDLDSKTLTGSSGNAKGIVLNKK